MCKFIRVGYKIEFTFHLYNVKLVEIYIYMMDSISDETASKETIVTLKFPDATHANKRIRLGVFFFFFGLISKFN